MHHQEEDGQAVSEFARKSIMDIFSPLATPTLVALTFAFLGGKDFEEATKEYFCATPESKSFTVRKSDASEGKVWRLQRFVIGCIDSDPMMQADTSLASVALASFRTYNCKNLRENRLPCSAVRSSSGEGTGPWGTSRIHLSGRNGLLNVFAQGCPFPPPLTSQRLSSGLSRFLAAQVKST